MSDTSDFVYYKYDPSFTGAVVFIGVFATSALLHTFQLIKKKTYFMIPFAIGGVFEAIGYAGRAISAKQTPDWTLVPYMIQTLFILLAPALLAASIYMWFGRLILGLNGEDRSMIKKKWLTKIFVTGDVVSFLMQCAGGGLMSSDDSSKQSMGQKAILGGLGFQIFIFQIFLLVAIVFHRRMNANPTPEARDASTKWQRHMQVMYFTSFLILCRNGVRVVEFLQGFDGYIISHEVYIYGADAFLMAEVMFIYNFYHPSRFLRAANKMSLDEESLPTIELQSHTGYNGHTGYNELREQVSY